MHVEVLESE
jgi:hypothetical protein